MVPDRWSLAVALDEEAHHSRLVRGLRSKSPGGPWEETGSPGALMTLLGTKLTGHH